MNAALAKFVCCHYARHHGAMNLWRHFEADDWLPLSEGVVPATGYVLVGRYVSDDGCIATRREIDGASPWASSSEALC